MWPPTNKLWMDRHILMNQRVDSEGCNVSSMIHGLFSVVYTISLDPIKFEFNGVEKENDKLQFETFLKVLGLRV